MRFISPRGVHPLWGNDAFPPVSDFPLFLINSSDYFTLSNSFLDFHSPKFLTTIFLVIDHKFGISLYFRSFNTYSPYFATFFFSPTFPNFPPNFLKFKCFFYIFYMFFISPYFDRTAITHHTMHVLYAPDLTN